MLNFLFFYLTRVNSFDLKFRFFFFGWANQELNLISMIKVKSLKEQKVEVSV